LAQALRRLGMTVEQRRRPYFDIATDSGRGRRERLYAFLDIDRLTTPELVAIRDYFTGGSRILTTAINGVEVCYGYRSPRLARDGAGPPRGGPSFKFPGGPSSRWR